MFKYKITFLLKSSSKKKEEDELGFAHGNGRPSFACKNTIEKE